VIFKRKHNWLMCWLYLATFGSFIGFAAAFPLLIKTSFPEVTALKFAFLGPLVGALVRPLGGWVADKLGGARVTLWNFVLMIAAVFGVIAFLPQNGEGGSFYGFLAMFMLLFVTTGIGNGSTFRMIPVIFRTLHERLSTGKGAAVREQALKAAGKESAAVLGFSSAIGAFGAFFIPKSFGSSIALTGGPEVALYLFVGYYVSCILVTWWWYSRKGAESPC
jgi:NNP family nitrate/nitrite transporter-like MFS transporter